MFEAWALPRRGISPLLVPISNVTEPGQFGSAMARAHFFTWGEVVLLGFGIRASVGFRISVFGLSTTAQTQQAPSHIAPKRQFQSIAFSTFWNLQRLRRGQHCPSKSRWSPGNIGAPASRGWKPRTGRAETFF